MVSKLAEVLGSQAVERGAVELRRAADEVVDLRLERLTPLVVPGFGRDVASIDEDVLGEPVLGLSRQPVASLEQEDPLAGGCEPVREGAATGAAPDHDHVVVLGHHEISSSRSAMMIRPAASINAR